MSSHLNLDPIADQTPEAPLPSPPLHDAEYQDQQLELGEAEGLTTLRRAWERTLRSLAGTLNKQTIDNWLRPLRPLSYSQSSGGSVVVLGASSSFAREFAEKKYAQTLTLLLAQHLDAPDIQVRFVIATPDVQPLLGEQPLPLQQAAALSSTAMTGESGAAPAGAQLALTATAAEAIFDGSSSSGGAKAGRNPFALELSASPLVPRYTFDNFVVGKSNRLAQAGAVAVAQSPGATYNPLFLYGPPGIGKTHLVHAIGHQIRLALPAARVVYVSGEMFTNHYVTAIRDKRTEDFRRAYRNVDVWLVDDIQMLASKEQTKEEFFHTFNALHQMNKQIVLTSDRPPRELRAMDERLRSRFECGLVADISAPELEMRQAILQKKAILEDLAIPEEVIAFMANLIQSNIRALEGALIKLMAYASLIHSPVTKQLASDVLSGYYVERMAPREKAVQENSYRENDYRDTVSAHPEDHEFAFQSPEAAARSVQSLSASSAGGPAVDQIIEIVARQMGVTAEMIVAGGGRSNRATRLHGDANFARQVAMYLLKETGGVPLTTLAATFGLKSHTAIVHAHGRLQKELADDPQILSLLGKIRQELEQGS